jgi:hypothetical protein
MHEGVMQRQGGVLRDSELQKIEAVRLSRAASRSRSSECPVHGPKKATKKTARPKTSWGLLSMRGPRSGAPGAVS